MRTKEQLKETKNWFFQKMGKIDKSLAKLTKRRGKRTQINKIRDKKRLLQQIPLKFQRLLGNNLETDAPTN
jgi:hypothetical protein